MGETPVTSLHENDRFYFEISEIEYFIIFCLK